MSGLLVRNVDPSTSHESADFVSVAVESHQSRFIAALAALGIPSTAVEVASSIEHEYGARETVRKRCGELLKSGHIREFGKRRCYVTGALARTFVLSGWDCPSCNAHRSDGWLLGTASAECLTCMATQEAVNERAAIARFDGGLEKSKAELLALNEIYCMPN